MTYWKYILASKPGGTLYIGVTNNLVRRVYEYRESLAESFTKRFGVKTLVYFESHETIAAALQREKNIKHWSREWRIDLIVAANPDCEIYMMRLSADAVDGLPGQARQ
jgi:putative endonuclease